MEISETATPSLFDGSIKIDRITVQSIKPGEAVGRDRFDLNGVVVFKSSKNGKIGVMLIREINEEMYKKIMDNRTVSEEEAKKTAQMVGLAAIKYGDLSNQASKDYVFDVDRFTSFEGNTGPYILYTIVRIKSILNKYQEENSLELSLIHI